MNHTPGPWSVQREKPYRTAIAAINGYWIADMGETVSPRAAADARLIAAAPELLAAAERAIFDYDRDTEEVLGDAIFDDLRAAIAKARGES